MIFHRITVDNLFSYRGAHTFDFSNVSAASSPICLVLGRNGFGKTSFLNSVKLLFLGSEDKDQRKVGFPPNHLSRRAYVMGNGGSWDGILNRDAKSNGEVSCSVSVELGTTDGVSLLATRRWEFSDQDFSETLEVQIGDRSLAGESAETRLDELLPRELVPFFLFDGEEVQQLAEASDIKRAEAMERLLSLSFVNGVESELSSLARDWRRESFPEDVQAQIKEVEGKLESIAARIDGAKKKDQDFANQIEEIEDASRQLGHQLELLRKNSVLGSADAISRQIDELSSKLETKQHDIAYDLAVDAPLLANPSLLEAALEPLRKAIDQKSKASQSIAQTLFEVLPSRLLEEPPQPRDRLSEEQKSFLAKKLTKILEAYAVSDAEEASLFDGLDYSRACVLLEMMLGVKAGLPDMRRERARRLREVSIGSAEMERLRAELREAQFGNSDVAEQYQKLESEHSELQRELGRVQAERVQAKNQLEQFESQKADLNKQIKTLEKEFSEAGKARRRVEIAEGLRRSFQEYRRARRDTKRSEIEQATNTHFSALMTGHKQVAKIQISEDFHLQFLDKDGRTIGYSTISHGMRQLAVTALLWALKDVSRKSLPIIVDTPLARIDQENQENLLSHYYPVAAEQVIVLATDSEIDERKFSIIQPSLGAFLRLSNPSGAQSSVSVIDLEGLRDMRWEDIAYG